MVSKQLFDQMTYGSLGNKIYGILRDRILNEEYKKGDKLNELILSKELGISRTPIREALKQLELEGLVESIPNKGVYVLGFSPRDLDDMFELRILLEGLAIELAIDRIDEVVLSKLKELLELMEFYTLKRDKDKLNHFNVLFHETIYQGTDSMYLEQLLSDVHYYVSVTSKNSISQVERMESSLAEHREILDAIMAKDKTLAKNIIQKHIRKTQMIVRKYYAKQK